MIVSQSRVQSKLINAMACQAVKPISTSSSSTSERGAVPQETKANALEMFRLRIEYPLYVGTDKTCKTQKPFSTRM